MLQILVNSLARAKCQSNLAAGFTSNKIRPIRIFTLTLYGIVLHRRVWCEHTVGHRARQTEEPEILLRAHKAMIK